VYPSLGEVTNVTIMVYIRSMRVESMQQSALGTTGIRVSRLSFGTAFMGPLSDCLSPQEGATLLLQALDQGVSTWDTSEDYGTHPHVACALRRIRREQVIVASKLREPGTTVGQVLDDLSTPYLDILFVHEVGVAGTNVAREMARSWQGEKRRGRVRAVGVSTHSVQVTRLAAEWPEVDVLMVPINATGVCTSDSSIEDGDVAQMLDATRLAWTAGKGIVTMKVMGCGSLADRPREAISFAARLPYVHSLCIGMRSWAEVQQNVELLALAQEN
jgi:aryl-alcohol dehydrogenase-like predicted oxidoreductase